MYRDDVARKLRHRPEPRAAVLFAPTPYRPAPPVLDEAPGAACDFVHRCAGGAAEHNQRFPAALRLEKGDDPWSALRWRPAARVGR